MSNDSKDKRQQLIGMQNYVFPQGYKLQTKASIWLDGKLKTNSQNSYKEKHGRLEGQAKWKEEVDSKHVAKLEFDFSNVGLDEFVRKASTASNSLVVWFQNQKRPLWRKEFDTEDDFVEWLQSQDKFVVNVADYVESRKAKAEPGFGTAKKFVDSTDDVEALKRLKAEAEAKLKELEALAK